MGRKLKRVPMNFAWPQGKIWGGYLNPYSRQSTQCDQCGGTGSSPEANHLKNQWIVVDAECERLGYPKTCVKCKGKGMLWTSPKIEKQAKAWTETEPPIGDGYQLWENTSEGSPLSPVFATIEELCAWCATGATTFGNARATKEQWREMLDADFVHRRVGNAILI